MDAEKLLVVENISKSFNSVRVLDKVNFSVYKGKVMSFMGENGAGKSTLMKIISGVYKKDEGKISIGNMNNVAINSVRDAEKYGIAIIHQELNLVKDLSVVENLFLGQELKIWNGIYNWVKMRNVATKLIQGMELDFHCKDIIRDLSISQQQMVEIMRALLKKSKILIMDEPTSSLSEQETKKLFDLINNLKLTGMGIVYISHRLDEIRKISDYVTIFRDGKFIVEKNINDVTDDEIIYAMVGRALDNYFVYEPSQEGAKLLKIENYSSNYFSNISLELRAGEIVGLFGLTGSKRTEIAKTIYGIYKKQNGLTYLDDNLVTISNSVSAMGKGIYYLTEDRKSEGLFLDFSIQSNISVSALKNIFYKRKIPLLNYKEENRIAEYYIDALNIKSYSSKQEVKNLSGGNQQKVAFARSLLVDPTVLILDEPTRGVDIGAKSEIYSVINNLKKEGKGILLISSELPELIGISDRIIVIKDGKIRGELPNKIKVAQEEVLKLWF